MEAEYFHNCLFVEQCPEGLVPRRFSASQQSHWDHVGVVRAARARSVAGTMLRLRTAAPVLSFSYRLLSACGEKMTFDMYEGGRLTASKALPTSAAAGTVTFQRSLWETEREVKIYLPFTAELAFSDFNFGKDAEPVSKEEYRGRVLWLGDSISQGMHAAHPSQTLCGILARRWEREIVNQGVGGCGYKDISQDFTYGGWQPDHLVMLLGTNDTGPAQLSWSTYEKQVRSCLDAAQLRFAPENIRLLTPFWRTDLVKPEIGEPFDKICRLLRSEAAERKIPLVEGFLANPRSGDFFWDQRLHPNDIGFCTICEALEGIL